MRYCSALFALLLLGSIRANAAEPPSVPAWRQSPAWTKDLVIYEIATKAFSSPNGPESGTFESLKARLPYLQELGVTGIWLTGHSLSDPHHFYNIWTQYAVIEPDQIDPSFGTSEQFEALIDEAHRRGIKVFLDVITHGVMSDSPLVKRHPRWFRGSTWGMADYDWKGGHTDLDDWWVKIWTDYVTGYGIDGFRLDVDIYRPDLWARIRQNAAAAGHAILIFEEGNAVIPGVTDFSQHENHVDGRMLDDVPGIYDRKFGRKGSYTVDIEYEDGTHARGKTGEAGALRIHLDGLNVDKASRRWGDTTNADGIADVRLTVENVSSAPMRNIKVSDDSGEEWNEKGPLETRYLTVESQAPTIQLYLATLGYGSSILLSCHDNGWTDVTTAGAAAFPLEKKSAYSAQGSRAAFGYSFLFTPMVPIFMAGEEFDADFHALPDLSPDLYGGRKPGAGRWLYGGQLKWSEVEQPRHHAMLEDVRRMLAIRRQEATVLGPQLRGDIEPRLVAVPYLSDITVPVPYMRWNGSTGIVVMANRSTEADAHLKLSIPLNRLRGSTAVGEARYRVLDLWRGGAPRTRTYTAGSLSNFDYVVKRDKQPRGGIGVLKIEAMH